MAQLVCQKCGRLLNETEFYTKKDGSKPTLCKKCMTMHIDPFDSSSFEWLLKEMDVPYIAGEWNILVEKQFKKEGRQMNPGAIFGKYLSKMKLKQWKQYGYADTERIVAEQQKMLEDQKKAAEMATSEGRVAEIQRQYEAGEISKAQYMTLLSPADIGLEKPVVDMRGLREAVHGETPAATISVDAMYAEDDATLDLVKELTEDDKKYLLLKWGKLYKPSQWIELERNYREMEESFDIQDQDTRNSLILCCKTFLKANEALDVGDVNSYRALMQAYDQLRKSAKFTAVQNKEEKGDFIDAVGEIVRYCEAEGGKIKRHDVSTTQDILDKEIDDMKRYYRSIIDNDPALSREIENYLKKKERAENSGTGFEEDEVLTDEDFAEFDDFVEEESDQNELG